MTASRSFRIWITLIISGTILLLAAPTQVQGRRARHTSWLTGPGGVARRCARCPPGWGVERRCEAALDGASKDKASKDTACTPCRAGESFSAHHSARSPCLLCSRCGQGLFTAKECTVTRDTHCAACDPPPPEHRRNQDYYRRCVIAPLVDEEDDEHMMLSDAPVEEDVVVAADDDDAPEYARTRGKSKGAPRAALASYGLSQSTLLPARSKSDMARSILADPGAAERLQSGTAARRLPHVLLADDADGLGEKKEAEYSLLQHQQAEAGPAYSVLTDDGPVRVAPAAPGALSAPPRPTAPRPPPPRYPAGPVRLSSPISWGRPSAPSLNTQQALTTPSSKMLLSPGTGAADLPLPLRRRSEEGDMNAEEVGRLML